MVGAFAQSRHSLASAVAVFLSMLVGCFASRACAADGADAPPPAVLIVHSNQRPTPAAVVIEDTLRGTIPAQLRRPVEVHSEYLDVEIPASATLVADQIAFLAHKYESRNVRAIIASAAGAVPFALRLREQMSSAVPIVHIAVPLDALPAMALPGNVVGKPVDLDPTATIKLALQLHPGVSRIVVVLGATERDRAWEKRIREAAARIVEAPDFEYIAGLPTDQVLRRMEALTAVFGLGGLMSTPVRHLSLGERMRCEIAASLLHSPRMLFLDEPTIGLDVSAKAMIRELLWTESERERVTLLLTSHDTGDMERVCTRAIVINHGRLLWDGAISGLRRGYLKAKRVTLWSESERLDLKLPGVRVLSSASYRTELEISPEITPLGHVVDAALRQTAIRDMAIEDAPLDEVIRALYATAKPESVTS